MLTTTVDEFCSLFDFTRAERQELSIVLSEIETNKFTTDFIFTLASLFQKRCYQCTYIR
jgi:hypothetical protein